MNKRDDTYYIVNVFSSDDHYSGIPVLIINEGHLFEKKEKEQIAAYFNFTYTVFLLSEESEYPYFEIEIYNPQGALDFSENALIATGYIQKQLVSQMGFEPFIINTPLKEVEMRIKKVLSSMVLSFPIEKESIVSDIGREEAKSFVNINLSDIDINADCKIIDDILFIPVSSLAILQKLQLIGQVLDNKLKQIKGLFAFSKETHEKKHDISSRFFSINPYPLEKSGDGNSISNFSWYLKNTDYFLENNLVLTIEQGYEINIPTLLNISLDKANDSIPIMVGGAAKLLSKGVLY